MEVEDEDEKGNGWVGVDACAGGDAAGIVGGAGGGGRIRRTAGRLALQDSRKVPRSHVAGYLPCEPIAKLQPYLRRPAASHPDWWWEHYGGDTLAEARKTGSCVSQSRMAGLAQSSGHNLGCDRHRGPADRGGNVSRGKDLSQRSPSQGREYVGSMAQRGDD